MKLLTKKQKQWLAFRNLKAGDICPMPSSFTCFSDWDMKERGVITPPMGAYAMFEVKEIRNGLCRVNFTTRPYKQDFYIPDIDLEWRGLLEWILLTIISFIPMVIYNLFTQKRGEWDYGTLKTTGDATPARRHRKKKNVQFVLWKKGDQKEVDGIGHTEDKWVNFDSSWWPNFIPNKTD